MNLLEAQCRSLAGRTPWVVGAEQRVPVLDGSLRRYINLDNAASTPALREVMETVGEFMHWYSSVHRGAGFKSRVATQAYEDARRIVLEFVGADPATHVAIFGKNTTEAINKLAARFGLGADDVVLVSQLEHHSNDLPWRAHARVEHVRVDALGRLDEVHLDGLLEHFAGQVRLVAVSGGSNVTGHMPDIHRIAAKVHAAGARIFVDCAQLAPHRAVDMRPLDDPAHLDYIAISAHKMYAPFGTGALISRRDTFERGAPDQRGGGTVLFVSHDAVTWAASPERDEAGSPNVVGAVALAAAMQALSRQGMDRLAQHEVTLTSHALSRLAGIPEVRVYGDPDPARAAGRLGVITFNVEGYSHALVAAILSTEFAIGVRHGCFCAHPYLVQLLGLDAAEIARRRTEIVSGNRRAMPGMVRISFGFYNTVADVDACADALETIARGGFKGEYTQDSASGEYSAQGFEPDLAPHFSLGAQRHMGISREGAGPRAAARFGAMVGIVAAALLGSPPAEATALYSRQTGQACGACHTAPPELTPFGRRFMLGGFTMTGGDRGVPLSGYAEAAFTHLTQDDPNPAEHLRPNDNVRLQRVKLISGGTITDNVGAFGELVYSPVGGQLRVGNIDLRWSDSSTVAGHDLLYGVSVNNNPGFQDPWNSTPARSWPYVRTIAGPMPRTPALLDGPLAQRAVGASLYGFLDDAWYAEFGAYGGLRRSLQDALGLDGASQRRIRGTALYARVAREAKLPGGSLTVGASALATSLDRPADPGSGNDRVRTIGVDLLWQTARGPHETTLRAAVHHERWATGEAVGPGFAMQAWNRLESFKVSASYLHAKNQSATVGYFRRTGSTDPLFFGTRTGRPDTAGIQLDAFVINPFFAPPSWHPGMRTRIGATLMHYTAFDGARDDYDGNGRSASDNDSLLVYFLWAF